MGDVSRVLVFSNGDARGIAALEVGDHLDITVARPQHHHTPGRGVQQHDRPVRGYRNIGRRNGCAIRGNGKGSQRPPRNQLDLVEQTGGFAAAGAGDPQIPAPRIDRDRDDLAETARIGSRQVVGVDRTVANDPQFAALAVAEQKPL